jgi:CRP-like cAMP-binding protein
LIPDVLSVLPLEVFSPLVGHYEPAFLANRLLRVGHLVVYFLRWERVSALKPSVIRIIKAIFVITFLVHIIGCIYHLVILLEGDAATHHFTGSHDWHHHSAPSRYLRSFYWAFVTITGCNNTEPQTQVEAVLCIIGTLIGIVNFATIIGTVGSLVTNLDASKLHFRQKMDGINEYMKYKNITGELQDEVRSYYQYLFKSGKGVERNKVLNDLPPYLKNKMNSFTNSELILKVPFFASLKDDSEFINEIVECLRPRISMPNSFVVRKGDMGTEMFFVPRGELNVINDQQEVVATLKDGTFFGEVAILHGTVRTASIVARSYCDMLVLTKEDFLNALAKFPAQAKIIRKVAEQRYELAKRNSTATAGVSTPEATMTPATSTRSDG